MNKAYDTMRLIAILLLVITFGLAITACTRADKPITIGIAKIVTHPALDALETGIMSVLRERYSNLEFDNQNANGEIATASTIAQKFKADKVDVAVGIATPTAQALVNTLTDIPVVFSAVTDPVDARLVESLENGTGNVTGISDLTPVKDQIYLLAELVDLRSLGHVYSSGEANAVRLAELTREAAEELGIEFVATTVTSSSEVKQAAQSIVNRVDAFYVSTDNTVVSALSALTDVATDAGIPVFSADPSSAEDNGVFMAWGFDYFKMGLVTGNLIADVLEGADPATIPVGFMTTVDDIDLFVNLRLASQLGIDIPQELVDKAATIVR